MGKSPSHPPPWCKMSVCESLRPANLIPGIEYIHDPDPDMDVTAPRMAYVRYTPEFMRAWLAKYNISNRPVSRVHRDYLARQIATGQHRPDHPHGIVFNRKGEMDDGQHRGFAIIQADTPAVILTVFGAEPENRRNIDGNLARRLSDRVHFEDAPRLNRRTAALVNALFSRNPGNVSKRASAQEALAVYAANREAIDWLASEPKLTGRFERVGLSLALAEYYNRNPALAKAFLVSLVNPDGLVQQARHLREKLLASGGTGGRSTFLWTLLLCISCMRAHMEGKFLHFARGRDWKDR